MHRPCILCSLLLLFGCGRGEAVPDNREPSLISIVMHDDDVPHIDFEGDLIVKETRVAFDEAGGFGFQFVAMHIPEGEAFIVDGVNDDPDHEWITFSGDIMRSGDDRFELQATLVNRIPVVIQYVEMRRDGDGEQAAYPEAEYAPGEHAVRFQGTVTGWYRRLAGE